MAVVVDAASPILNAHNRVFADPTGDEAIRQTRLAAAGVTPEFLERVEAYIAQNTTTRSARAVASRLGVARLKVEAAIEALIATNRVRAISGVLVAR